MFGIIYHPAEQQALAHILMFHNPFYTPSMNKDWFAYTPVEELAAMRHFNAPQMAPPTRVRELCDHPIQSIYT